MKCKCGCGKKPNIGKKFVSGHNSKLPNCPGTEALRQWQKDHPHAGTRALAKYRKENPEKHLAQSKKGVKAMQQWREDNQEENDKNLAKARKAVDKWRKDYPEEVKAASEKRNATMRIPNGTCVICKK